MKGLKNKIYFSGDKLILPWDGWQDVPISPAGIHTHRGVLHPSDIDLLYWKASFYMRGTTRITEEDRLLERLLYRMNQ